MKGFVIGLLLFITLPVWVCIGIVVAGLIIILEVVNKLETVTRKQTRNCVNEDSNYKLD